MANALRQKPPVWFTVAAVVLVLWGLAGCGSFYAQQLSSTPPGDAWDRAFMARQPIWLTWVYAVAVGAGLGGSIALLAKSALARPLYIVSLIAVVIQFGYIFAATELLAHKGAAATVPFPLFIFAVAAVQLWLAGFARRKGWIG